MDFDMTEGAVVNNPGKAVEIKGKERALYQLDAEKPGVKQRWKGKPKTSLYSSNATPVIFDGTMYGADIETSVLAAVDLKDGKRLWETKLPITGEEDSRIRHGTVFLTRHEPSGRFYLFNDKELVRVDLAASGGVPSAE